MGVVLHNIAKSSNFKFHNIAKISDSEFHNIAKCFDFIFHNIAKGSDLDVLEVLSFGQIQKMHLFRPGNLSAPPVA